jgi:hypothetical protein
MCVDKSENPSVGLNDRANYKRSGFRCLLGISNAHILEPIRQFLFYYAIALTNVDNENAIDVSQTA